MHHNLAILLFLTLSILWTNPFYGKSIEGLYFSDRQTTENGYLLLGIEIFSEKGKSFYNAQELRYKKTFGWEEVLFVGKMTKDGANWILVPEACQIRAKTVWDAKFALLRRFDCDHLVFHLTKNEKEQWVISESLLGTEKNLPFRFYLDHTAGNPVAVQIPDSPEVTEGFWGFHLNGLGGKPPAKIWNPSKGNWEPFSGFKRNQELQFYQWKRSFSN